MRTSHFRQAPFVNAILFSPITSLTEVPNETTVCEVWHNGCFIDC